MLKTRVARVARKCIGLFAVTLFLNLIGSGSNVAIGMASVNAESAGAGRENPHWSAYVFAALTDAGIIENEEFLVDAYDLPISRGEFIHVFARLFEEPADGLPEIGSVFTDISADSEYYAAAYKAKRMGLITGYEDGAFRPDALIERQDIFTIVGRAYEDGKIAIAGAAPRGLGVRQSELDAAIKFTDEARISGYAKPFIEALANLAFVKGYEDGTVRPEAHITVAEAMAVVERVHAAMVAAKLDGQNGGTGLAAVDRRNMPAAKPSAKPSPAPSAKPAAPPAMAENAGSGGNGGNSGGGNSSVWSSDYGGSENAPSNATDEIDWSRQADIDALISLHGVKSVKLSAVPTDTAPYTNIVDPEEIKSAVRCLRELRLSGGIRPTPLSAGSTLKIDIAYQDGSTESISYLAGSYLLIKDKFYRIKWDKEAHALDILSLELMKAHLLRAQMAQINGIVAEADGGDHDINSPIMCKVVIEDGSDIEFSINRFHWVYLQGAQHGLGSKVEVFFSDPAKSEAEWIFEIAADEVAGQQSVAENKAEIADFYIGLQQIVWHYGFDFLENWLGDGDSVYYFDMNGQDAYVDYFTLRKTWVIDQSSLSVYSPDVKPLSELMRDDGIWEAPIGIVGRKQGATYEGRLLEPGTDSVAASRVASIAYFSKDVDGAWQHLSNGTSLPLDDVLFLHNVYSSIDDASFFELRDTIVGEYPWISAGEPEEMRFISVGGYGIYIVYVRAGQSEFGIPLGSVAALRGLNNRQVYPIAEIVEAIAVK